MGSRSSQLYGQGIWNIWIWMAAGILFAALNIGGAPEPRSPYWFSEIALYGLMLAGMWANAKYDLRKKIRIPRSLAPLAYVFLVWLFGMLFEVSLTVTGEGIGGLHAETLPSFILAQGDYIPIALISYFVIRKTQASFREVFFFAGGKSLTEGLIFTGVLTSVLLSPMFWLSPLVVAYYTIAYASFIALPLLFIDEERLWKEHPSYSTALDTLLLAYRLRLRPGNPLVLGADLWPGSDPTIPPSSEPVGGAVGGKPFRHRESPMSHVFC